MNTTKKVEALAAKAHEVTKPFRKEASDSVREALQELRKKILHLTNLVTTFRTKEEEIMKDCVIPTSSTPPYYDNPVLPSNKTLSGLVEIVEQEAVSILKIYTLIKFWIQLCVPPLEEGQRFGVEVQTEVVGDITAAENNADDIVGSLQEYHESRASHLHKICKYENIENYKTLLREFDRKIWYETISDLLSLRNDAAMTVLCVEKNEQKIVMPSGIALHMHHSIY
ncbi:putative Proteasome activator pa28 beta subunit [Blattamonas nauphoetae]|uniref:Proteasome activator pa28 beta subunit n=1 Tax=Blattamonas nauphoetae TaxID=2049346 RepID=A0ABQ9YC34_9EUKA|nr:putative Proteasome activator pa28 beta subunit [Blattamonas nauphoetae]